MLDYSKIVGKPRSGKGGRPRLYDRIPFEFVERLRNKGYSWRQITVILMYEYELYISTTTLFKRYKEWEQKRKEEEELERIKEKLEKETVREQKEKKLPTFLSQKRRFP